MGAVEAAQQSAPASPVAQTVPPRPPAPPPAPSPPDRPLAYARGSEGVARAPERAATRGSEGVGRGYEGGIARGYEPAPARPEAMPVRPEAILVRAPERAPARPEPPAARPYEPPPVPPTPAARSIGWYVASAAGQTGGPYPEEEMRAMIARQQLRSTDSVVPEGGKAWIPIMQSPFAPLMGVQARAERPPRPIPVPAPAPPPAPVGCPRCGTQMLVGSRPPVMATIFIIVGICFAGAFIGIPFLIVGWHMRRNSEFRYSCPGCGYSRIELLRFRGRARSRAV